MKKLLSKSAQSSVEFALIFSVLILVIVGIGAIANRLGLGVFLDHAIKAASHNIIESFSGLCDSFCY